MKIVKLSLILFIFLIDTLEQSFYNDSPQQKGLNDGLNIDSNLKINYQTNQKIIKQWETFRIFTNSTFDLITLENQSFQKKIGLISLFSFNKKIILQEVFGYQTDQSSLHFSDHLHILKDKDYLILQYQEANQISANITQQQQLELFINTFIYKSSDLLIIIVNSFQPKVQLYLQKIYEIIDQNAQIITLHYIAQLKEQKEISEYESQLMQTNYLTKEKHKGISFYSQYYNSYDLLKTKKQIIYHMLLPSEFSDEFHRYVEELKMIINYFQQNRHEKKQVNFKKFTETLNQQYNQ